VGYLWECRHTPDSFLTLPQGFQCRRQPPLQLMGRQEPITAFAIDDKSAAKNQ